MNSVWDKIVSLKPNWQMIDYKDLFPEWHDERYFVQCYFNLEEKYDCGGILQEDWTRICSLDFVQTIHELLD